MGIEKFGQERMATWLVRMGFVTNLIGCITSPLWSRTYAYNIPYWMLQVYDFLILLSLFGINKFGERKAIKEWCFYHFEIVRNISIVLDLLTVVVFQISGSYIVLLLGDLITMISFAPVRLVHNELGASRFSGNARATFNRRFDKYIYGAQICAVFIGILIGALFVTGQEVPVNVLLVTQYANVVASVCVAVPNSILYRVSKPDVERMWLENEHRKE